MKLHLIKTRIKAVWCVLFATKYIVIIPESEHDHTMLYECDLETMQNVTYTVNGMAYHAREIVRLQDEVNIILRN